MGSQRQSCAVKSECRHLVQLLVTEGRERIWKLSQGSLTRLSKFAYSPSTYQLQIVSFVLSQLCSGTTSLPLCGITSLPLLRLVEKISGMVLRTR